MKKVCALSLTLIALFAVASARSPRVRYYDVPPPMAIGTTVEDFNLPDADGKDHSLNSLKGKNGTILIFVATKCPVSNAYNERMEKLAQDYKAKGINVIGVNSNAAELAAEVKSHAANNKLTFTILKDGGNKIADTFGATVTPEAFSWTRATSSFTADASTTRETFRKLYPMICATRSTLHSLESQSPSQRLPPSAARLSELNDYSAATIRFSYVRRGASAAVRLLNVCPNHKWRGEAGQVCHESDRCPGS